MADIMDDNEKDEIKDKPISKGVLVMVVITLSAFIIFYQMAFVLMIVGLLPSIVARFSDTSKSAQTFHTILACNLSGVLPFIIELVTADNDVSSMYHMLKDMQVILVMWFSAAVGYALVYITPKIALLIILSLNERKMQRLKSLQEKLLQEWGVGIVFLDEDESRKHIEEEKG